MGERTSAVTTAGHKSIHGGVESVGERAEAPSEIREDVRAISI